MERKAAFETANSFVQTYFPTSQAAILGGSVVRGEATATSDLDIIILNEELNSAYRESMYFEKWPIEVFVHNQSTIKDFFEIDCKRARPSLPRLVSEGVIIKDNHHIIPSLKSEATKLLRDGPPIWDDKTTQMKRYFLTDLLDDFIGSNIRAESIFIAGALGEAIHEFVLRTNGQWIGASKWIVRALKQFDEKFTQEFVQAFDEFYSHGDKKFIIELTDRVLEQHGGRYFAGFSMGKEI
ncbi:nucleotidyltransferase domain-containing protein [Rossellomorea aquimaris]|uniref:nucleotidyltransferase domain-containing protein n=1 Tax=Rossellomorea aquimaris TaxID=189382 RepID=UPI0007D05903|nr:nucleotidyltransferase domain-containing protein [Rossellomorea aquimaris]